MHKVFNCGLVEGSFNPPHLGHIDLIGSAINSCSRVIVRVGTSSRDTLDFNTKRALISQNVLQRFGPAAATSLLILEHKDDRYHKEEKDANGTVLSEKYWETYLKGLRTLMNDYGYNIGAVFSSDLYGSIIADKLGGVSWCPYDPNRNLMPISSTKIRNYLAAPKQARNSSESMSVWRYMVPELRRKEARLITFAGPEGSGKSTCANYLRQVIVGASYVPEYGRTYSEALAKAQGIPTKNLSYNEDDFHNILKGHEFNLERAYRSGSSDVVVSDTDYLTTKAFAKILLSENSFKRFSRFADAMIDRQMSETYLYVLLHPDFYKDDDGSRFLTKDQRYEFHKYLKEEVSKYSVKTLETTCSRGRDMVIKQVISAGLSGGKEKMGWIKKRSR